MASRQYFPARSVLFRKEARGLTYRIPALIFLRRPSCFLAFCEERLGPADSQAHLLALRRGVFYKNYIKWEDLLVLSTAALKGHRSMNPCPVYDACTGTLFLFFIAILGHTTEEHQLITGKNVTRLCYVHSQDHGETWSPATDLTKTVIGDTIKDWATFALGPGHGIQLKSGRLLIPAYSYHIVCKHCFGKVCRTAPHSFCFYSDTHGTTWHFGRAVPGPECVECQMVSVDEDGGSSVLYCNARSSLGFRVQALSFDDGVVFQAGQLVQKLAEPRTGCHGSVIGFPAPVHTLQDPSADPPSPAQSHLNPTWVVYGHPSRPGARQDLGLYLSARPRDPDSWKGPWVIYEGPSAYSDLAYVELESAGETPAAAFACLFENGTKTAYEEISFCIFTLHELINNLPPLNNPPGRASAGKKRKRRRKSVCDLCTVC